MADDARERIFFVGKDGTPVETSGIYAMVAGGSDVLLNRRGSNEQPDTAPRLAFIQTIERMARRDAGLAAGTSIQVDFERVLLARLRLSEGNETAVGLVDRKVAPQIVPVGESFDGCPFAFLSEQCVDKGARTGLLFNWRRKRRHSTALLKGEGELGVTEVGVAGTEARGGPGLIKVFAGEEMAVTHFELQAARDGETGDGGNFGAKKTAVG